MASVNLEQAGLNIALADYAVVLVSVFVAGIQLFVAIYTLIIFLGTPEPERQGRRVYIIVSFLVVLANLARTATNMPSFFYTTLKATDGTSFVSPAYWHANQGLDTPLVSIFNTILFILVDGILLYRCYIIVEEYRWVLAVPVFTYVATIGFSIAFDVLVIMDHIDTEASNFTFPAPILEPIGVGLSVASNLMISALIVYYITAARKRLSQVLSQANSLRPYTGATYLLIESTAPLSVIGVCYAAIYFAETKFVSLQLHLKLQAALAIFEELYFSFLAISPHIIILRVTLGRSWARGPDFTDPSAAFSHSLAFTQEPELESFPKNPPAMDLHS
ncbi:hypothetical protein FA15DRAFT_705440 [Coprinopsis marcescibilis]|uniref:Uncharacterized protein n=1 Tax=Coprinopsis marcescibilis TaxID=230819 RepID=A0A5C3KS50_COPMA|nr:hypothetical protein FA15DRAFT_705440 [Coprinopsis marcescibilis]